MGSAIHTVTYEHGEKNQTIRDEYVCGETRGEHVGSPLRTVVQWFKTMTTNEYIRGVKNLGWTPFAGKLWQRNYYEHIIRNQDELIRIRQYIRDNPLNWQTSEIEPFS